MKHLVTFQPSEQISRTKTHNLLTTDVLGAINLRFREDGTVEVWATDRKIKDLAIQQLLTEVK